MTEEITIQELSNKKQELRDKILKAVKEFEGSGYVEIDHMSIGRMQRFGHPSSEAVDIRIEVKLI